MSNRRRTIETVAEAATVYGGVRAMAKAFGLRTVKGKNPIKEWMIQGFVPRGQQLALYLGLKCRGREPSPRLMGVLTWEEIPGVSSKA